MINIHKSLVLITLIALIASACTLPTEPVADPVDLNSPGSSENDPSANLLPDEPDSTDDNQLPLDTSDEAQESSDEPRLSATVTTSNYTITEEGYFSVFGIAENTDTVPMEFIKAVVVVKDSSGSMIIGDFSYTYLDVLQPGETSPFNVIFMQVPDGWSYYEITMMPDPNLFMQTLTQFEILSDSGSPGSFGNYEISGQVQNSGDVPATYVEVSAAVFDAAGILLGVGYGYADLDVIEPQATSSFSLSIPYLAEGEPASYQLWVEANLEE